MALTSAQRMQIRLYLGWSERFHQTDSRLEHAMNALDQSQSDDARAQVIVILGQLASLDTAIGNSYNRLKALKVGSIGLSGPGEIGMLRSEGRRLVGRIASLLGVEVRHDVYMGKGPVQYASATGMKPAGGYGGGGGNLPPLG